MDPGSSLRFGRGAGKVMNSAKWLASIAASLGMSMRFALAALALALMFASSAFALEPADLVGAWDSEWANAAGEPVTGGGPLRISLDSSPDSLDGVTPAPGMDGMMNGETLVQPDGSLVWSGRWASVWPEGTTTGTFRFVFSSADTFAGTWSTDDKQVQGAAWVGSRAH